MSAARARRNRGKVLFVPSMILQCTRQQLDTALCLGQFRAFVFDSIFFPKYERLIIPEDKEIHASVKSPKVGSRMARLQLFKRAHRSTVALLSSSMSMAPHRPTGLFIRGRRDVRWDGFGSTSYEVSPTLVDSVNACHG